MNVVSCQAATHNASDPILHERKTSQSPTASIKHQLTDIFIKSLGMSSFHYELSKMKLENIHFSKTMKQLGALLGEQLQIFFNAVHCFKLSFFLTYIARERF